MRRALGWAGGRLRGPEASVSGRMCSGGGGGDGADRRFPLAGRVAVITGSTDGIGLAVARRLGRDGAHVVLSSRQQENVTRAVASLQAEGLSVSGTVCHIGKTEDRERLVAKHSGGVDFLVCVAGVNPLVRSTWEASEQIWDKILDVNVKSPALLLGLLVPHMEKRGYGPRGWSVQWGGGCRIIPGSELLGPYNVSKTAILGLTKTLALELKPKGIRVNCLAPGLIKTNFSQVVRIDIMIFIKPPPSLCPRTGKPEDCAGVVSFLCSPDAGYITGETIVVAGGSPRL
uniref:Dehydrogenase/reductase 2 n=1 Tax=Ornithorhynchus anatinus TaxID=9258 RepID=F6XP99_ORNAN